MARQRASGKAETDLAYFSEVLKGVKGSTTVSEMEEERVVPTMFTSFNRATCAGGMPLGCLTVIHGPEQVGKSAMGLMLVESLRRAGHVPLIVDSEFAAEKKWYSSITPESAFKMTNNMNEVWDDVTGMLKRLDAGKAEGRVPRDAGCIWLLDTVTQFMTNKQIEEMRKSAPDRAYAIQVMFLNEWIKDLVPKLRRSNSTVIAIVQERAKMNAKPFEKDYKMPGGKSLQYMNRMRIRVYYSKKLRRKKVGGAGPVLGMECRYTIENNKIVGTSYERGVYFTANGRERGVDKGLDLVREAVAEADHRGWLKKSGKSYKIKRGSKLLCATKNGEAGLLHKLRTDPDVLCLLVGALNEDAVT